jgi:hypothetical protein
MGQSTRYQKPERQTRADAEFKPVALPALAAAVKASKDRPREAPHRELPPILRKEASLG